MQRIEHSFVAMGGPARFRIDCDDEALARAAISAAEAEVRRLESKYSRYLPDSLISKINRLAGSSTEVAIDRETAGLLNYAQTLWRESNGLFDITSGVLRRAWNFKSSAVPSQREIDALLPLVGWQRVELSEVSVRLPVEGMELDFGGCVKEYACDCAAAALRRGGIKYALVDLAGDMAALGGQYPGVGDISEQVLGGASAGVVPWKIGIRHPRKEGTAIARFPLLKGGLASSGNYERCIVFNGRRYGHILNPKTGWPVEGLAAVSVAADQCLVAGGIATIAMLGTAKEALSQLRELDLAWLAVDAEGRSYGPGV